MEGSDPSNRWRLFHHITTWASHVVGWVGKGLRLVGKKLALGWKTQGLSVLTQTHPATWPGEFVVYWIM
jgi:hypothetical protein